MKITKIEQTTSLKLVDGTLPDIDSDFPGRDRAKIKEFMEQRFGKDNVCSVGTFTTMKPKGIIKDFDRQFNNDYAHVNLITSIIDDTDVTMKEVFARSAQEPKLKKYIQENSDIFHMMPVILEQPKTQSIHACAMIVFPDVMSAYEWAPMRMQKGLVVSEWGGTEMDEAGFLKDDILGVKQLDKFQDIVALIKENGKEVPNLYELPQDPEVYRYFSNGWNGDVFQFGTSGLTAYTKSMKPQNINDLITAVAIFRPGPMENHFHEIYVKCKNEGRAVKYLWGTEEITKDTFGLLVYQEQIMQVCQQVGGLTMKEADDVRRAMGKKKVKILNEWKERIQGGFEEKGCSVEEFEEVWNTMIEFAKYGFNKSHAAAYAITGYVSQWLKVNYPIEYWTVALSYANEKELPIYLAEIFQAKKISIVAADVNGSGKRMKSDLKSNKIYWGVESLKGIGEKAADQIIEVREEKGRYKSFSDFIEKNNFKGSAVKKTTIEALIIAGAFDEMYSFNQAYQRKQLMNRYRIMKKVKPGATNNDIMAHDKLHENWLWQKRQKEVTGLLHIDYKELCEEQLDGTEYASGSELSSKNKYGPFRSFGGYVVEAVEKKIAKGKYMRISIESNYQMYNLMIWPEEYKVYQKILDGCEGAFIVFTGDIRFDDKYSNAIQFVINSDSELKILK